MSLGRDKGGSSLPKLSLVLADGRFHLLATPRARSRTSLFSQHPPQSGGHVYPAFHLSRKSLYLPGISAPPEPLIEKGQKPSIILQTARLHEFNEFTPGIFEPARPPSSLFRFLPDRLSCFLPHSLLLRHLCILLVCVRVHGKE